MIRRLFSSNALQARKFLFVKEFKGDPTAENFELVADEIKPLKEGDVLTSAEYISVDPYMLPCKLTTLHKSSITFCSSFNRHGQLQATLLDDWRTSR